MRYKTALVTVVTICAASPCILLAAGTASGVAVDAKRIEAIMVSSYSNLNRSAAWQLEWEKKFNRDWDVPVVKKLLEGEPDTRWARVLLDDRIIALGKEKDYSWTTGILWHLSGGAEPPYTHPLETAFEIVPADDQGRAELLGTSATLKTLLDLHGKPTRVEKGTGKLEDMDITYYGLVGFYTKRGRDEITGLRMPFVLFKLGFRDFARLVLSASKADANGKGEQQGGGYSPPAARSAQPTP